MPITERDITQKAFATDEWQASTRALFQATGVSVNAMSFSDGETFGEPIRCTYCGNTSGSKSPGRDDCFDDCPSADAGEGRIVCRSGIASLYAPVTWNGRTVAHVTVSGFVTSTRERRGLYEQLLTRGASEDAARRALKALPVVTRRQAESYLEIATSTARTLVAATAERLMAAERVEQLRSFVTAGQQVALSDHVGPDTLASMAEEAIALVGGAAGAVLAPNGSGLRVAAATAQWRGPVGATVPRAETAAGRAYDTRKAVVAPPARDEASGTLAVPLAAAEKVVGVLEVRMPASALPLSQERVARLNRFGKFIAIALGREEERRLVDRAMNGYDELNKVAGALGSQTSLDGVARVVLASIERSFTSGVAGVIVSGWGNDRADVAVSRNIGEGDVDHLLSVVSGRSPEMDGILHVQYTRGQDLVGCASDADDWALSMTHIAAGELTVGWLFTARRDGGRYRAQDKALLEAIAAHAGAALERVALFLRIRDDYADAIAALSTALVHEADQTPPHAGRVMEYAMKIGEEMGLDVTSVEQLRLAGILHDVGTQGLRSKIILKPSVLSIDGLSASAYDGPASASILEQVDFLKSLTPAVLHHHERWDGQGYPAGLKGLEIPVLSRILAVADSFDAHLIGRNGTRATIAQALMNVEKGAGTLFDPSVVSALVAVLNRQAMAGETGLIAAPGVQGRPALPA